MHQDQSFDPQYGGQVVDPGQLEMPSGQMPPHPMMPPMPHDAGGHLLPGDPSMHPMPTDASLHPIPSEAHAPPQLSEQTIGGDSGYWKTCDYPNTPRLTVSADAMVWFLKDSPFHSPLVTTSANPADLGVLHAPTTTALFGDQDYNLDRIYGARLSADLRICDLWHLEGSGFGLEDRTRNFSTQSLGYGLPLIAIPTFGANTGASSSIVLASPGVNSGGVNTQLTNEFWGVEANVTHHLCSGFHCTVDTIYGLRYLDLTDNFDLVSSSTLLRSPGLFQGIGVPTGSSYVGYDSYGAHNQFYGGQIGARVEMLLGRFTLSADSKVAIGENHETITIGGGSNLIPPGSLSPSAFASGGLLTGPGNIGRFSHDEVTYLPEFNFKVSYYLRPHIQLTAGCDLLYWNSVVRATDQIDQRFNTVQGPFLINGSRGTGVYAPSFRTSDFWAEGFSLGLSFCY